MPTLRAASGAHACAAVFGAIVAASVAAADPPLFEDIAAGLPPVWEGSAAWGDFDGDSDLDILLVGDTGGGTAVGRVYRNVGGLFVDAGLALDGVFSGMGAWGDFDNDNALDPILTGLTSVSTSRSVVYRNGGTSFVEAADLLSAWLSATACADYDNDGDQDVLLSGYSWYAPGYSACLLYRNDAGTFVDAGAGFPGLTEPATAWGDYDGDGDLDLAIVGSIAVGGGGYTAQSRVYRNDAGSFVDIGASLRHLEHAAVAWGDMDDDGDLDLAISGYNGAEAIGTLYGNVAGTFVAGPSLPDLFHGAIAAGDFDHDGDLDLAMSGENYSTGSQTLVLRQQGSTFTDIGAGLPAMPRGSLAWGDYDGDGDLDLLATGNGHARVFRNNTVTPNSPPSAPEFLRVTGDDQTLTFHWDAAADDHTPASGLSYNLRVGTTPGGADVVSPMSDASGIRRVPAPGNVGQRRSWSMPRALVGDDFYWAVQAIDRAFLGSAFSTERHAAADVGGERGSPEPLRLSARPNPFRDATVLQAESAGSADAEIAVFDCRGRRVRTLLRGELPPGTSRQRWDGRDEGGRAVGPGIYFCRLRVGTAVVVRRVGRAG